MATSLGCSPDEILDWKESKLYAWLAVAREDERKGLMLKAQIQARAFHDPETLADIFGKPRVDPNKRKLTDEEKKSLFSKVEKIRKMEMRNVGVGDIK